MDMDAMEELMGSKDRAMIVKGRRSKRPRQSSPAFSAVVTTSDDGSGGGGGEDGGGGEINSLIPSVSICSEISTSTEEDEDMANCLILLAQSGCQRQVDQEEVKVEKICSRKFTEMATTTTVKAGIYVYECKTCNRTFPSFQALGGHRASHKKPKQMVEEKKAPITSSNDHHEEKQQEEKQFTKLISPPLSSSHGVNKAKIHECSICGLEFSSGQALGGHMRRHRTPTSSTKVTMSIDTTTTESSHDGERPRNILQLDLNLPAPEDDHHDSKFQFSANKQHLFSSPALVDCHY